MRKTGLAVGYQRLEDEDFRPFQEEGNKEERQGGERDISFDGNR